MFDYRSFSNGSFFLRISNATTINNDNANDPIIRDKDT